jgi:hypothetical protein
MMENAAKGPIVLHDTGSETATGLPAKRMWVPRGRASSRQEEAIRLFGGPKGLQT